MAEKGHNLIGQVFGRLTVTGVSTKPKPGTRTDKYWDCVCTCGGSNTVSSYNLLSGKIKSCGCILAEYQKRFNENAVLKYDLTGKTFGRWTVLGRDWYIGRAHVRWLCRCSCGTEKSLDGGYLRNGTSKSCGCLNRELAASKSGKNHQAWKGGRTYINGYVKVYAPDHPNARGKYVFEHIKVMSETLGRPLSKIELVHHKNGIKDDNRAENLELWVKGHPSAQRVDDLISYILENYTDRVLFAAQSMASTVDNHQNSTEST